MAQSYLISAFPDTRSPRRRPIQFPDHPRRQYHFLGLGGFPILTRCTCVHILILVAVDWDSNAPASPPQRTRSRAPQITRLLIPTPTKQKNRATARGNPKFQHELPHFQSSAQPSAITPQRGQPTSINPNATPRRHSEFRIPNSFP